MLTLSDEAIYKISKLNVKNLQVYILDLNGNWLKVDLLDARDSKTTPNLKIFTNKNELLFYSDNQIVVGGVLWFTEAGNIEDDAELPDGSDMP